MTLNNVLCHKSQTVRAVLEKSLKHVADQKQQWDLDGCGVGKKREQIMLIQQIYEVPDILGIAWQQSSVSGDDSRCGWWVVENDTEQNTDSRHYNIFTDSDHFFITPEYIQQGREE